MRRPNHGHGSGLSGEAAGVAPSMPSRAAPSADEGAGSAASAADRASLVTSVYIPAALLAFGQGLLIATLPLYAADLGAPVELVSLAVGAAAIGTLLTDLPAGALLARMGLRAAMIGGAAVVAVSTAALAVTTGFDALIAGRLLAGVGASIWALSRHAYLAEAIPAARRGKAISVFGGINRLGVFLGPAAGGFIAQAHGLNAPFAAAAALAAAAMMMSIFWLKPAPRGGGSSGGVRWTLIGRLLRTNGRDIGAAALAQTFGQMIRAGRLLIVPLYGAQQLGFDAAQIGLILTASAIVDVTLFVPAGVVMDRFGRKVAAVPSFAVLALGVALIPLANGFLGLLLASLVIGLGNGIGSGTMMTLGTDLAPPGATGEFLGLWRLIGDAGMAAGPLAVGAAAAAFGLAAGAYALAAIGLVAALTMAGLVRETRTKPIS